MRAAHFFTVQKAHKIARYFRLWAKSVFLPLKRDFCRVADDLHHKKVYELIPRAAQDGMHEELKYHAGKPDH